MCLRSTEHASMIVIVVMSHRRTSVHCMIEKARATRSSLAYRDRSAWKEPTTSMYLSMTPIKIRSSVAMTICLVVGVSVPAVLARAIGVGPALAGSDWAATAVRLRGHNGSRFLFVCPAGGTTGRLWGAGMYTDDSSV